MTDRVPITIPLQDGVGIYSESLYISEQLIPGKWKLVQVSVGRSTPKNVPLSDDISFEIPELRPIVVHIQAPTRVQAGRQYSFTVTLDEYPRDIYKDCELTLGASLKQAAPRGQSIDLAGQELRPNQLSYNFSYPLEPDIPSGPWQIELVNRAANLVSPGLGCRHPQLKGDVPHSFEIVPATGLVTPTSVAVTVNPSQVQLLLEKADLLKAKAQHLRQQLSSGDIAANQDLMRKSLQTSLQEAMTELDATEKNYKEKGVDALSTPAINAFFDDIRFSDAEALKTLIEKFAQVPQTGPRLVQVNGFVGGQPRRSIRASDLVLASIQHNVDAYEIAASSKLLTFNLDVYSVPQGATISYRLGGGEYHPVDHETDWQIPNLPRAVYFIKVSKNRVTRITRSPSMQLMTHERSIRIPLARKTGSR